MDANNSHEDEDGDEFMDNTSIDSIEDHSIDDTSDDEEFVSPEPSSVPMTSAPNAMIGPQPLVGSILGSASQFWNTMLPNMFPSVGRIGARRGSFNRSLRVYSIAMLPHARPELENGGKVMLPPSALQVLTQGITLLAGPMLFKVTNTSKNKITHCGVLEFIADEGKCFMPFWMMHNIGADEGDMINVENVTIPIATYALFQPQTVAFLDITNPKALLENVLRNFACITKGEIITIRYNDRTYDLKILDTQPSNAVNIIECDMNVDFAPPIGYVSPSELNKDTMDDDEQAATAAAAAINGFIPFEGAGNRLDGKIVDSTDEEVRNRVIQRGLPDFEWEFGTVNFSRRNYRKSGVPQVDKEFTPFQGAGQTIKGSNTNVL